MTIARKFIPGEEWLYVKIYAGPKILESLLINELLEVIVIFYKQDFIDKFFFIRFMDDTGYHLRLRFHLKDPTRLFPLLDMLRVRLKEYIDHRLVVSLVLDTYNRELERYGSRSIHEVESLFQISSLQIISLLKITRDYTHRWMLAAKAMDQVLGRFGLDLRAKHLLYDSYFKGYIEEFGFTKATREALKVKYREYSRNIDQVFKSTEDPSRLMPEFTPFIGPQLDTAAAVLLQLHEEGQLQVSMESMLKNLLHLHYNRTFRVRQRFHEFVLYHLMAKYYQSSLARQKNDPDVVSEPFLL